MKLPRKKLYSIGKLLIIFGLLAFWTNLFIDFQVAFTNQKVTLWCHAPNIVEADENFTVTVEAWDQYERLAGAYKGTIHFQLESYNYSTSEAIGIIDLLNESTFSSNFIWKGLFPAYKFSGADNGKKSFQMNISIPGIHYLRVVESDTGNVYRSNAIIVQPEGNITTRLYWGDLHGHTLYSDGSGLPSEAYEFARDVALLDFAAISDHSEHFIRFGDVDLFGMFQNIQEITNRYNTIGEFVTLQALEWTPKYVVIGKSIALGHQVVYFRGDSMPFFSTYTHKTPYELYNYISENTADKFIAWTHHTLNTQFASDFAFYNASINRMIEIYSVHGSCECVGADQLYNLSQKIDLPGFSVRDALKMGRKFGILSSSDTHDGRLGHSISHTQARCFNQYPYTLSGYRINHPYPGGITGLFSPSLNRSAIFDALKLRAGYASTWVNRHYLEFRINGLSVGQNDSTVIVPTNTSTRHFEILACADGISMGANNTSNITELNVYKNSELWKTYTNIDAPFIRINNLNDTAEITGTEYTNFTQKADGNWYIHERSMIPVNRSQMNTDGADYYYIRMRDSNGGAAWIGPIWVEVQD